MRTFLILVKKILPEPELTILTALRLTGLSCGELPANTLLHRLFYSIKQKFSFCEQFLYLDRFLFGKLSTMSLYLRLAFHCPERLYAFHRENNESVHSISTVVAKENEEIHGRRV